jgi:Flp pilus assembly secretin CpaC
MRSTSRLRGWVTTATGVILGAVVLIAAWSGTATAADITVPSDEARLVRLDRPATEVIVGNPSIADVAVQNGKLLVVTGKTFGITNVIVLDARGREILNKKVRVGTDNARLVRIYKGRGRSSYDCAPRCETALVIGDAEGHFESLSKETRNKFGIAQQALEGEQGGQ